MGTAKALNQLLLPEFTIQAIILMSLVTYGDLLGACLHVGVTLFHAYKVRSKTYKYEAQDLHLRVNHLKYHRFYYVAIYMALFIYAGVHLMASSFFMWEESADRV